MQLGDILDLWNSGGLYELDGNMLPSSFAPAHTIHPGPQSEDNRALGQYSPFKIFDNIHHPDTKWYDWRGSDQRKFNPNFEWSDDRLKWLR